MANRCSYFLALGFYVVSFILCCIAYGTGFWFVGNGDKRLFTRLGLWEACFDGYEHTSDYIGKAYYGCWWIFHKEYWYIRDWIMPPWFKAVQIIMTFGLIFEFISLGLVGAGASESDSDRITKLQSGVVSTLMSTLCIGTSVIVFGVMIGEDRTWMPRPDIDSLGWSYGLAVLSGFFSAFSCISLSVYTLMRKYELLPQQDPAVKKYPIPRGGPQVTSAPARSYGGSQSLSQQSYPAGSVSMVPKV